MVPYPEWSTALEMADTVRVRRCAETGPTGSVPRY